MRFSCFVYVSVVPPEVVFYYFIRVNYLMLLLVLCCVVRFKEYVLESVKPEFSELK